MNLVFKTNKLSKMMNVSTVDHETDDSYNN